MENVYTAETTCWYQALVNLKCDKQVRHVSLKTYLIHVGLNRKLRLHLCLARNLDYVKMCQHLLRLELNLSFLLTIN